jgi:hypothetical protein
VAHEQFEGLFVPPLITSPSDVTRLRREILALDNYLEQESLRTPGAPQAKLPKTSRLLDELATSNGLNLLEKATRQHLTDFLTDVYEHAPVVHISFATDPSSAFMQKVVQWFRQNIHPSVLVRIGLQPTIAAGCVVRTTNQYFDFSLRQHLKKHQPELLAALKAEETVQGG